MRRIDIIFPSIKRVWVSHPLAIGYRLTANNLNSNLSSYGRMVSAPTCALCLVPCTLCLMTYIFILK